MIHSEVHYFTSEFFAVMTKIPLNILLLLIFPFFKEANKSIIQTKYYVCCIQLLEIFCLAARLCHIKFQL